MSIPSVQNLSQPLMNREGLERLPYEVTVMILGYLPFQHMETVAKINPYLKRVTLTAFQVKAVDSIESWIGSLINNLDPETNARQITGLSRFLEMNDQGTRIMNATNLFSVKSSISDYKREIIKILKSLSPEELDLLERENRWFPEFFEKIFKAVRLYQKRDEIVQNLPPEEQGQALADIADGLAELGEIDEAVEIFNTITDSSSQDYALAGISYGLAKLGEIEHALHVVKTIEKPIVLDWALGYISRELMKQDNIDRAHEIACTIDNSQERDVVLREIALAFMNCGQTTRAFEIARTIHDSEEQDLALSAIFTKELKQGYTKQAYEIACYINRPETRDWALRQILFI
ncbi:MAG: hypothetical protein JW769_01700 [Parachlamydiales bacterium]|nr:hypothetical protein [Parachlamydiales bacterium]